MKGIISRQIPDSPSDSELISELTGWSGFFVFYLYGDLTYSETLKTSISSQFRG